MIQTIVQHLSSYPSGVVALIYIVGLFFLAALGVEIDRLLYIMLN
jgi:hypothetical protein